MSTEAKLVKYRRQLATLEANKKDPAKTTLRPRDKDSHPISLPTVRPASSHLPQVWRLPHLFSQDGQRRLDSGSN